MAVGDVLTPLKHCVFCFGRSIPASSKGRLAKAARSAGATTVPFVNATVTHYVTEHWEAKAAGVHGSVVTPQFITDALELEQAPAELPYLVLPLHQAKAEQFSFVFSFEEAAEAEPPDAAVGAADYVHDLLAKALGNIRALRAGVQLVRTEESRQQCALSAAEVPLQERDPATLTSAEKLKLAALRRAQDAEARRKLRLEEQAKRQREREHCTRHSLASLRSEAAPLLSRDEQQSKETAASYSVSFLSAAPVQEPTEAPPVNGSSEEDALSEEERRRLAAKLKAKRKKKRALVKKRKVAALAAEKGSVTAEKKAAVRRRVEENAAEGKEKAAIMAKLKQKQKCGERAASDAEWSQRQEDWKAEQERRLKEWEDQKKRLKAEKKAKREAFLQNRAKILAEDKAEKGRKLFVGKLRFDDIQSAHADNEFVRDSLIEKRKELYRVVFRQFGLVESFKEAWESGHFFVVFYSSIDARKSAEALSTYEGRKAACASLQNLGEKAAVPRPSFYVRWPRNSNFSRSPTAPAVTAPAVTAHLAQTLGAVAAAAPQREAAATRKPLSEPSARARKPVLLPPELAPQDSYADQWKVVKKRH